MPRGRLFLVPAPLDFGCADTVPLRDVLPDGTLLAAARNMRLVRIRGRPMSAVGSSLSIDSSRAMPRPSLLALPAQSYGCSACR